MNARHGGGTEAHKAGVLIEAIADHMQKSDVQDTRRDYRKPDRAWRRAGLLRGRGWRPAPSDLGRAHFLFSLGGWP